MTVREGAPPLQVFYLHGFASSAQSSKAAFFKSRLAAHGLMLHTPDFNLPDFATLTASRMIAQVEAEIAASPAGRTVLIGSSLGGFVGWHVAARAEARGARLHGLLLLAPAFDFGANRVREMGEDGLEHWRRTGWREFFHYAYGETRRVHYALYEDARRYDSHTARVTAPVRIVQGRRDASVDPAMVERFAADRPNIALRLVDDDHQLLDSLDIAWHEATCLLGLPAESSSSPQRAG